jgi:hypothetical protein
MSVPELPAFDAKAFASRLWERVTTEDGRRYPIFAPQGPKSFPSFIQGLRVQQDNLKRHDVQLGDHKEDLDLHSEEIASLKRRVAELEALPVTRPFP